MAGGVLDQEINRIRDLHFADMDTGILGTASDIFVSTQVDLIAPVAATEATLTKTQGNMSNTTDYRCPSSVGVGNTFREYATYNAANLAKNRIVFTGFQHTSADEIIVKNTWYYEGDS